MPNPILRIAVREFSDFEKALAEEIAVYRRSNPEVEFEVVPFNLEKLHTELLEANGLRSGAWDIGFLVTDWLAEAIEEGAVEELTPHLQRMPVPDWPQGWAHSIVDPLYFGESLYTLPWHDGPECLIYRRDLFEDAVEQKAFRARYGYALEPPATWNQFTDVARFFTRPGRNLYGTLFAAFPDGHNTLYDFTLQLWSRSGELEDKHGNALLNTPQAVESLEFYRKAVRDPSMCYPGAETLDSTHSGDVFLSGAVAMMVNWFGFATRCDRPDSPLRGKVSIAAVPAAEVSTATSLSVFWTLGIGAGSKHKRAAFDFLHFLTSPERDRERVKHGTVGVRLSTWRNREIQTQFPVYGKIEAISLMARTLPRSRSLPSFARIVNEVVTAALTTDTPSAVIMADAQRHIAAQRISFR